MGERLAEAAQLAATARTVDWLDQLTIDGLLSPDQRARIAAEDGAASLARVLRRAELAGEDPRQLLHDALHRAPTHRARTNTTNVLHARITDGGTHAGSTPIGERWADWAPRTGDADWDAYLGALAVAADDRAAELGRRVADEAPPWALDTFGPVPEDARERADWEQRAGVVAAYREFRGHDNAHEPIGPAPKPGQVEAYAAYRNAWRVAGRPEIDQLEHEMSDGLHRMRIRGWEREKAWGPRYVGNELAGTRQAADQHRRTATLHAAEADAAADPHDQARLRAEASQAAALARTLDARVQELEQLDEARAVWLVHTAETRAAAEISEYILAERHAHDAEPERTVTAEEWLAAEQVTLADDDAYRDVAEHDLNDDREPAMPARRPPDELDDDRKRVVVADGPTPDIRDVAAAEPRQRNEDVVREVTAKDTADATARARRSLTEIEARAILDAQAPDDGLIRWTAEPDHLDDIVQDDTAAVFDRQPAEYSS